MITAYNYTLEVAGTNLAYFYQYLSIGYYRAEDKYW